ncbi:type IV secretory system conjugative DNA transfer family protein [Methylobacterium sp. 1030]|uniref:type IV secretory system conjugative DNA transfer family protein n=1 Tax=Methylobacterium sp. 1030 TaxID=3156404 RepID=UPI003391A713
MAYDHTSSRYQYEFEHGKRFQKGDVFLGYDADGQKIGISTESSLIGIAGTGGGKTTCLIAPNVIEAEDNIFCIDPTAAVVNATWEIREKMGRKVRVLDPYRISKVPDRLIATYNPFEFVDQSSEKVTGDMNAIFHAMIVRHDPKAEHWDAGSEALARGIGAHLLTAALPPMRTLPQVRDVLTSPALDRFIEEMGKNASLCGLAAAGAAIMASHNNEAGHFKSSARTNTMWLDAPPIRRVLEGKSNMDLRELKTGDFDLFVILPIEEMEDNGRFLRLFVSLALRAMFQTAGDKKCLFILDEFFSLGKLEIMLKAFAAGRSRGIRCFPFVQDLGQLDMLYGKSGLRSFLANSSAHILFHVEDHDTLEWAAKRIGQITVEDLGLPAHAPTVPDIPENLYEMAAAQPYRGHAIQLPVNPQKPLAGHLFNLASNGMADMFHAAQVAQASQARQVVSRMQNEHRIREAQEKARYDHVMKSAGKARIPPEELGFLIAKPAPDKPAKSMVVFTAGSRVLNVRLHPFYLKPPFDRRAKRQAEALADRVAAIGVYVTSYKKQIGVRVECLRDIEAARVRNRSELRKAWWKAPALGFTYTALGGLLSIAVMVLFRYWPTNLHVLQSWWVPVVAVLIGAMGMFVDAWQRVDPHTKRLAAIDRWRDQCLRGLAEMGITPEEFERLITPEEITQQAEPEPAPQEPIIVPDDDGEPPIFFFGQEIHPSPTLH